MRATKMVFSLCAAGLVWCATGGCGQGSDGQTDLVKLPPPSQALVDQAKAKGLQKPRPRFAAPAKSERAPATALFP